MEKSFKLQITLVTNYFYAKKNRQITIYLNPMILLRLQHEFPKKHLAWALFSFD